jgi:hypothetical protein
MSERFKGVGQIPTTGGTMRREMTVTASSLKEAKQGFEDDLENQNGTLVAIYDEWEYSISGALRGNLRWSQSRGTIEDDESEQN